MGRVVSSVNRTILVKETPFMIDLNATKVHSFDPLVLALFSLGPENPSMAKNTTMRVNDGHFPRRHGHKPSHLLPLQLFEKEISLFHTFATS